MWGKSASPAEDSDDFVNAPAFGLWQPLVRVRPEHDEQDGEDEEDRWSQQVLS